MRSQDVHEDDDVVRIEYAGVRVYSYSRHKTPSPEYSGMNTIFVLGNMVAESVLKIE